jgi:hypothetical protein
MTISYVGQFPSPADNVSQDDTAARAVAFSGLSTGALMIIFGACKSASESLAMAVTAGQSWTSETLRQGGASSCRAFWGRYNGTFVGTPSIETAGKAGISLSAIGLAFAPTSGTNTWALDSVETYSGYSIPVSPFDVTAPSKTAVAASTVTVVFWYSEDDNTWALQTVGWTNPGGQTQWRNAMTGKRQSVSAGYKIQTSAGATGAVVNEQTANGGDRGRYHVLIFKEQSAGVTLANIGDELVYDGETDVTIDYAGGSASGNVVTICSADSIGHGSAVTQTVTTQGATQLKFTANLTSFNYFEPLYVFVTNGSAQSNSNGFVIERQRRMQLTVSPFKSLADVAAASLTDIQYTIYETDLAGAVVLEGVDGTTNGSGVFVSPIYAVTEGGPLSSGGDVLLTAFYQGANQAASKGTCFQVTPTYS